MNIGNSTCETVATVTDTYGFNSVTSQFEPCTDTHCQKCAANKNTCTQCLTASGFYKNTGNNPARAWPPYGHLRIQLVTSQFEPCTDTHCQKCAANKNTCTQCHGQRLPQHRKQRLRDVATVTDTYGFNSA
jgi:hypothetical protein